MTPDEVRKIIREELAFLIKSDRFTFQRDIQMLDGRNIQLATGTGTKIGTGTDQKLGFFNTTPVTQRDETGNDATFTQGSGTALNNNSEFNDYKIGQVVRALQDLGILA